MKTVSPKELNFLRGVAVCSDALQFGLIPAYFVGIGEVLNGLMDIFLFLLFTWRLGFHVAFLPTFITEFIPFVDLVPAWSLAVLFVTRNNQVTVDAGTTIPPVAHAAPIHQEVIKDIKAVNSPTAG